MQIDYSKCDIPIDPDNRIDVAKALASVNGYPFTGKGLFCSFEDILGVVKRAEFLFKCWVPFGEIVGDQFEAVSGTKGITMKRGTYTRIRRRAKGWSLVSVARAGQPIPSGAFSLILYGEDRRNFLRESHPELERINLGNEKPLRVNNNTTRTRRSKASTASPATDAISGGGDRSHEGSSVEAMGGGRSQDAPGVVGTVLD